MDYYQMVESAWKLSDSVREYSRNAGREVDVSEVWEKIFSVSPEVDLERTRNEGGTPLNRVFLKSPYGLNYRPDTKDWIPFRHSDIQLPQ